MKRVLVVLVLLAASADARRVVHIPTLAELCPGNGEWDKVAQCIRRQGAFKMLRETDDLKLVRIEQGGQLDGIYLYRHAKQWSLRGSLRLDDDADMLGFERITLGSRTGYRLDVGMSSTYPFSFNEADSVFGVLRRQVAQLCFDEAPCVEAMTACDVLIHGKAYFSFRGKLVAADKRIKVVGDRRNAGPYCEQAEDVLADQ